jgi:hypothetical protein
MTTLPLPAPYLPDCPHTIADDLTLAECRDHLATLPPHEAIQRKIDDLYERWEVDPDATSPLQYVRGIMDFSRAIPRGDRRLQAMNTIVQNFGDGTKLAIFLDMMRASAVRTGSPEELLSLHSRHESKHSLYGWAGQTKLVSSSPAATAATLPAEPGVQTMFGGVPASQWGLNLHIWQANPLAKGFVSGMRPDSSIVVEPPHSHPFDFLSKVAVGEMRQSTYAQRPSAELQAGARYGGVTLMHVHGVWPPHAEQQQAGVATLENRVTIRAGESYYMPCNKIHDVEVDAIRSRTRPAITLFLRSEAVVRPHVYMAETLVRYHEAHPDLERSGQRLSDEAWHAKLQLVSAYLRGEGELSLDDVVRQSSSYGFFHE